MITFAPRTTALVVRPGDLDRLGHVNNARALEYLEHARWDWSRANGLALTCAIAVVVMRAEVDYLAPVGLETLEIDTELTYDPDTPYRACFSQAARFPGTGKTALRGLVTVALVDTAHGGLRSVEDFLQAAASLEEKPCRILL